jgi:hypothetical protein
MSCPVCALIHCNSIIDPGGMKGLVDVVHCAIVERWHVCLQNIRPQTGLNLREFRVDRTTAFRWQILHREHGHSEGEWKGGVEGRY